MLSMIIGMGQVSVSVVGVHELYEKLLPTKFYLVRKENPPHRMTCCAGYEGRVSHILAGCSALAQKKKKSKKEQIGLKNKRLKS